jgi:hypothetical protein
MKPCKDCVADLLNVEPKNGWRPAPHPGPRCVTHHGAWKRRNRDLAHGRRLESNFGITSRLYWAIYEFQGGRCAICRLATGKAKRLAVDHDHELAKTHDHPLEQACRLCVRGLLCSRCNRWGVPLFLGAILRALDYLTDPPARKVLDGG